MMRPTISQFVRELTRKKVCRSDFKLFKQIKNRANLIILAFFVKISKKKIFQRSFIITKCSKRTLDFFGGCDFKIFRF